MLGCVSDFPLCENKSPYELDEPPCPEFGGEMLLFGWVVFVVCSLEVDEIDVDSSSE